MNDVDRGKGLRKRGKGIHPLLAWGEEMLKQKYLFVLRFSTKEMKIVVIVRLSL